MVDQLPVLLLCLLLVEGVAIGEDGGLLHDRLVGGPVGAGGLGGRVVGGLVVVVGGVEARGVGGGRRVVSLGSRSGAGNPVLPCAGGEDSCALGCALARVVVLTRARHHHAS